MELTELNIPEAPSHWNCTEAAAWQSGYETGATAVFDKVTPPSKLPPYVIDEEHHFIRVCAWCYPKETIFKYHPHLLRGIFRTYTINHGICGECRDKMRKAV